MASRGHEVTWWTSTVDHFTRTHFVTDSREVAVRDGLKLQFLHGRLYRRNVSFARLVNHRQIAAEFTRLARERPEPAVILCSYPTIELSQAATAFGRRYGIPVVLDLRDLWPDAILAQVPQAVRGIGRVLLAPMFRQARKAFRGASGIIAISESYMRWGLDMAGRERSVTDRVFPLGYMGQLPPPASDSKITDKLLALGVDPTKRIFWFSGSFVGSIDLGTVIESARDLVSESGIQFVLTGAGEWATEWQRQAKGLSNVIFTGWAGAGELAWLSKAAWVGLCAYRRNATQSLPNKLFEYMSMGLPVLLALEGEARRLVETDEIGAAYEAGDHRDLTRLVQSVAGDAQWHARCSANARELFERKYASRILYREFVEFIESIGAGSRLDPAVR
jgi:glycosyltransferase involved in cell wall biosynthesis